MGALLNRSRDNFLDTFRLVWGRWARRKPRYRRFNWLRWIGGWVALTLVAFLFLDHVAGAAFGKWPGFAAGPSAALTKLGLSRWCLVPAAAILLVVNLIHWRCLSVQGRAFAANWTAFALYVLCSAGLSGIAVNALKYGLGRARPTHFAELGAVWFDHSMIKASFASFPSGHATTMGAMFGVVLLLFPRWRYPVLAVAVLVCASRVVVGAHYPSDVIAGFGLGLSFALAFAGVFARLGFLFNLSIDGLPIVRQSFRLLGNVGAPSQTWVRSTARDPQLRQAYRPQAGSG